MKSENDKTQVEKRIAEIKKKVEYFPNEHFSDEVRFLLVQLKREREENSKQYHELQILAKNFNDVVEDRLKLIEALQRVSEELNKRFKTAWQNWGTNGDMYEQGKAAAYDEIDTLMGDTLKKLELK